MVGFIRLRDFNDCQFSMRLRSQWRYVLFFNKILMTVVFFCFFSHYEISMTVGFIWLWDCNDGRFCWVMRFQWQSVLFGYEISMTVSLQWDRDWDLNTLCFDLLQYFNDAPFCSFRRSQQQSVSFLYKISMPVSFVISRDFSDHWFCMVGFVWLRDFNDCQSNLVKERNWLLLRSPKGAKMSIIKIL